jgi:hypothetical protein
MRVSALSLLFIAAALLGQPQSSSAQSPYSYSWCAVYTWDGSRSCYYTSKEQCLMAQSGVTNLCIENPGYRPPAPEPVALPAAAPPKPAVSPRNAR